MDEYNIREKHIKLTTLKMDYNILKTSKTDEFDHFNHDEREMSEFRRDTLYRIQNTLSHIERMLKEIDCRIEYNLTRMPIHLEVEIERSLEKHLRDFVKFKILRFLLVLHRNLSGIIHKSYGYLDPNPRYPKSVK